MDNPYCSCDLTRDRSAAALSRVSGCLRSRSLCRSPACTLTGRTRGDWGHLTTTRADWGRPVGDQFIFACVDCGRSPPPPPPTARGAHPRPPPAAAALPGHRPPASPARPTRPSPADRHKPVRSCSRRRRARPPAAVLPHACGVLWCRRGGGTGGEACGGEALPAHGGHGETETLRKLPAARPDGLG